MVTTQEICEAIRQSQDRVVKTFSSLSDEQLDTRVNEDGGDQWTAREVLAHLASRQALYDRLITHGSQGKAPFADLNIDEWNRPFVEERKDWSRDRLLDEFQQVHNALIEQVQSLPAETLAREVPYGRGTRTLGELIVRSGATHSVSHTEAVEQALGISGTTSG